MKIVFPIGGKLILASVKLKIFENQIYHKLRITESPQGIKADVLRLIKHFEWRVNNKVFGIRISGIIRRCNQLLIS